MCRFIFLVLASFFIGCGSDDPGNILVDYPITYKLDEVNSLGMSSYFYTDTIIYKTNNDLTSSLETQRAEVVKNTLFNGDSTLNNFIVTEITFMDPQSVSIRGAFGENSESYSEISGLGSTKLSNGLPMGFKINPDLDKLITCYTQTSSREIDTLFENDFLPELDTLYTEDSLTQFQLVIDERSDLINSFCENFNELSHITEFANSNGLKNNDRIVSHRTDIIFIRSEQ